MTALPPLGTAEVVKADSRNLPYPDNSVDLIVTSPPYFALRSYQDTCPACRELERTNDDPRESFPDWAEHTRKFHHYAGQIGDETTPAEFVTSLLEVTRECMRVLKPTGSMWVNLGDKYATYAGNRSSGRDSLQGSTDRTRKVVPRKNGLDGGGMVQQKSLMGIPWRYAIACIDELGLILRAEVIWSKPNGLPESVTDRVRRSHEQWFHFTLQPRYFSAVDEIREPHTSTSPEHDARRRGRTDQRLDLVDGGQVSTHNPLGKLPGSVWTIPTEPLKVPADLGIDHFAAFPTEWPRRIINGFSPAGLCDECGEGRRDVWEATGESTYAKLKAAGEMTYGSAHTTNGSEPGNRGQTKNAKGTSVTYEPKPRRKVGESCACGVNPEWPTHPAVVLDPFGGTGTTAMVAKALGRHGISVDMSADYCRLAEWRTNDENQIERVRNMQVYGVRKPTKTQIREAAVASLSVPPATVEDTPA